MEQDKPESEIFQVNQGDRVVILDWRTNQAAQVIAASGVYWDSKRKCWSFHYFGFSESPAYAVWETDHWEDGEY